MPQGITYSPCPEGCGGGECHPQKYNLKRYNNSNCFQLKVMDIMPLRMKTPPQPSGQGLSVLPWGHVRFCIDNIIV